MGLDPGTPGSHPGLEAGAKPLSHPGIPQSIFKVFGLMSYRNFRILLISAELQKEVTCYTGTLPYSAQMLDSQIDLNIITKRFHMATCPIFCINI